MIVIQLVIMIVFFLLEMAALFAYGYWGFHLPEGWMIRAVAGIGTPLIIVTLWVRYIAPKASYPVSLPVKIVMQLAVFLIAAVALYSSGQKCPKNIKL